MAMSILNDDRGGNDLQHLAFYLALRLDGADAMVDEKRSVARSSPMTFAGGLAWYQWYEMRRQTAAPVPAFPALTAEPAAASDVAAQPVSAVGLPE